MCHIYQRQYLMILLCCVCGEYLAPDRHRLKEQNFAENPTSCALNNKLIKDIKNCSVYEI